jgi:hypothetical protein
MESPLIGSPTYVIDMPYSDAMPSERPEGQLIVVDEVSASPLRRWHQRMFIRQGDSDLDDIADSEAACWASMLFCLGMFFLLPNILNLLFFMSPYRRARIWACFS